MTESTHSAFDVAIIGFGPVGASLAALLGKQGRRVAVFDKSQEVYPLPRAFALDHEAMRTFQQIGIAGALSAHMTPYRPTIYQGSDGEPIQHFDMGPSPYPLAWAPSYTFNQPALETALRHAVAEMSTVHVRLGHEVEDVQQDADGAVLTVRKPGGPPMTVRARYAVACDGGTSATRKRLGLKLRSLDFDEPWVVVDLHVNDDVLARLPATNVQYCNPARPCTYVVGPGTHRRWEFLLMPEEAERREMPHEAIWALLAPWLAPGDASIWRAATYRFHAVVLDEWRRGSILMAGDSAHQMPPFLAQGMCQGLRDAMNLSWKLDWVLRGRAPAALLDSYGEERGPQVDAVTSTVKRLGHIICERDPERAKVRDRTLREQQGNQVRVQLRQNLLPGIRHGLIDCDSPPAGTPFPQPVCRGIASEVPQMMDDLVPPGFLIVVRDPVALAGVLLCQEALTLLDAHIVCMGGQADAPRTTALVEVDAILAGWFDVHGCIAALVRPDHVVYGIAKDGAALVDLVQHACDRMGVQRSASAP